MFHFSSKNRRQRRGAIILLTIFLLIGVLAAAVGTRFLQLRSRRSATSADVPETQVEAPSNGV